MSDNGKDWTSLFWPSFVVGLGLLLAPEVPGPEWVGIARASVGAIALVGGALGVVLSLPSVEKLWRRQSKPALPEPDYEK